MSYVYDRGVSINGEHSFNDWGLMLVSTSIKAPDVKTKYISIPFRNGDIDVTEAVDADIKYENRDITINLRKVGDFDGNKILADDIINKIHGINARIVFDDDLSYYYVGRIEVSYTRKKDVLNLTIKANCEPFKYNLNSTGEEWDWDSFDFIYGIINNTKDLEISEPTTVVLLSEKDGGNPTISSDKDIKVTYNNIEHMVNAGTSLKFYDYVMKSGDNLFIIKPIYDEIATVTIDYRGGKL